MKITILLFYSIILSSCNSSLEKIASAELWEKSIISSELPEFGTTLTAKSDVVYFNRTTADRSEMKIMESRFYGKNWSEPITLPFSTGKYLDVDPFIVPDGTRLYFTSDRPKYEGDSTQDLDTWYVNLVNDKWSDPVNVGRPLNSDSTEIFISMSQNENAYFVSESDEDRGIKVSRKTGVAYPFFGQLFNIKYFNRLLLYPRC